MNRFSKLLNMTIQWSLSCMGPTPNIATTSLLTFDETCDMAGAGWKEIINVVDFVD